MTIPRKALALISGGLDSMLATKLVMEQGVHVEGINFFTPLYQWSPLRPSTNP